MKDGPEFLKGGRPRFVRQFISHKHAKYETGDDSPGPKYNPEQGTVAHTLSKVRPVEQNLLRAVDRAGFLTGNNKRDLATGFERLHVGRNDAPGPGSYNIPSLLFKDQSYYEPLHKKGFKARQIATARAPISPQKSHGREGFPPRAPPAHRLPFIFIFYI